MMKQVSKILAGVIALGIVLFCTFGGPSPATSQANREQPSESNEPRITNQEAPDTNEPAAVPTEPEQKEPNEHPAVPEELKELETEAEPEPQPEPSPEQPPIEEMVVSAVEEVPEAAEAKPGLVSNVFFDTDLRQALHDIATQVGVIIVPDESVVGLVTCTLEEVPLEKALEIVLAGTSYVVKETPDYYMVCSADPTSPSFPVVSETRLIKLNHIKADAALKLLSTGFSDYVRANPDDNTVAITARPALMERIVSDLKAFDQPRRHVMLDARVVVMERGDLLNLGIQWDWPGISAGTFSDSELHGGGATERVNWPWGIQIGYTPGQEFTNSLLLTLNLLNQNDDATVVASPQLLAQDGQQAEIKVATEEYFKITEESYYYTRFELETIETGTTLTITPSIGDNNEITLEISTEVSDVIARGEDNLPIVTRRTTKNTVRIEDGGTAAIAGLMDSRTRLQKIQAPGLADIPIFGELFRNTSRQRSSRQVAVFVTARLMPETGRLRREPVEDRAPIEPVGEEFRTALQEILSRLRRGDEKS